MSDIPPEGGKKPNGRRTPTLRIENEYDPEVVPQYFQVTVNVLEAKNLAWAHPQTATSYVVVALGKKRRRSHWRKNMEEPYYREYFVFELYTSLRDIRRKSVRLAVMESRRCGPSRLLGEANVDLSAIWEQPYHQVYHKWAQLLQPKDQTVGAVGYLKVDIAILFRGEPQHIPETVHNNNIEENLLLPSNSVQQRANFIVAIHNAYALPSGSRCFGDRRYGKAPDTFVKVTFAGLTAKTAVQSRNSNPSYNEQISIVEMFPNMSQDVHIEVCSGDGPIKKVICGACLRLSEISNDGDNGFLPTFGPSLLPMYGASCSPAVQSTARDGPYYKGSLLIALSTQVPYYLRGLRTAKTSSTAPLHLDSLWSLEEFCVYCPVFEVSMIDKKIVGNTCSVAITMGEVPINKKYNPEFLTYVEEIKSKKLYNTGPLDVKRTHPPYGHLEFTYAYPVLELATRLPDFRFRMYRNNMVYGIFLGLESAVVKVERRLKTFDYKRTFELTNELDTALEDTAANIMNFLQIVQETNSSPHSSENTLDKHATELDRKQMKMQKEDIESIYHSITNAFKSSTNTSVTTSKKSKQKIERTVDGAGDEFSRKTVKHRLSEAYNLLDKLKSLIFKSFEGWPDIVIWLLINGSRVAYAKIFVGDIIFSTVREQRGQDCAKIQSIFMKPLVCPKHMTTLSTGCFCIAAKVELLLWMGLYAEKSHFPQELPDGYRVKTKDVDMCVKANDMLISCRAFIYRGKLNGGLDSSGLADPFVRINIFSTSADTETKWKTLTPIWNQILKIRAKISTSSERLNSYTPIVIVEVYDRDDGDNVELMGRSQIEPVLESRSDYTYAPKLQWYDLFKGVEFTGQILMSAQLLQIKSEEELDTVTYDTTDELVNGKGQSKNKTGGGYIEELPENLIPVTTTYKLDVYWWGLRDMTVTRKPCAVLEMDEMTIKSQTISEKKSNSNFPDGKASEVFEAPLNELYCPPLSVRLYDSGTFGRTVFVGTNVIKNPNKYMIRWLPQEQRETSIRSSSLSIQICQVSQRFQSNDPVYSTTESTQNKILSYNALFGRPEEERTLLPLFTRKKKYVYEAVKIHGTPEGSKDWWLRFFCSQAVCTPEEKVSESDMITIYKSELENQPQFAKFKDWCATFKLYSGKKTGVPDKDAQLFCGFLKAGIALYKWPPPSNTIAVSPSGVDLHKGFFNDHPSNDPSKFLVRVYIIKGFNLMAKDFTGKSDPYLLLKCGKKTLGERKNYIPNTLNPVFGRLYEFQCSMPDDYLLTIYVYDYDIVPPDDLIGCTSIDLEDRVYTKHRATCGLSTEYSLTGANKWRDCMKPSTILKQLCIKNHIPGPTFPDDSTVMVDGVKYKHPDNNNFTSSTDLRENICLNILHKWHTLPICGYPLVPEHIETRTLYNQDKPGLDQGKLQLWVDIFPLDTGLVIPPPVDVTPQKVVEYELRVVVWDTEGISLDDYNVLSGERSSDIYVKAWIGDYEKAQQTDIHYRSLTGVGNFNWRMIFHFFYQHAERKMVLKGTGMFANQEDHVPPVLVVQVMDSDAITADDFLGSLSLNLNSMPRGAKMARQADISLLKRTKKVNLFSVNSIRGWWPLKILDHKTGTDMPAGVIDLEMTLLPKEKAVYMPAGLGREGPHPLPLPKRPETSFNVYMNPLLTLKTFMRNRGYKSLFITVLVAVFLILLLSAVTNVPRILLEKWLK